MTIETDGGTTFTVVNGNVTITRSDQPEATIPYADLREFFDLYEQDELEEDDVDA